MLINVPQDNGSTAGSSVSPTKQSTTRKQTKKLLTRIRAAHLAGKWNIEKRHIALFLNSYAARHTAVVRASKQLPKSKRPDAATIKAIAQKIDPWNGTQEPVAVSYKPKKSGVGRRITMNFGIENRALQYLILMVLEKTADLHPHQYATKGRVPAAIKQVAKAMSDGNLYAVELDITNCYPSFVGEKVPDLLPLPKKVTLHTLICNHLNLTTGNLEDLFGTASILTEDLLAQARHGIPQGSAASNLLAEILLSKTLANQSPSAGRVFSYADNILIVGQKEGDVKSMQLALESALKTHPAGPLVPNAKMFSPGDPVDFLGHRLTCKSGKVLIEPSPANLNEFEKKLTSGLSAVLRKTTPIAVRRAKIKRLRTFVRSWVGAFKACCGIKLVKDHWLSKLAAAEKGVDDPQ